MDNLSVRIGLVPSYRFQCTPWCIKMRDDAITALRRVTGVEVVVPEASPDAITCDAAKGLTPHGMVATLDQADVAVEFFASRHVDALLLLPLDFGDERSAAKVAERLRVPVLLVATREPPAPDSPDLGRVSDSYCGTLSMASALYRRKIPFHYAGIYFPGEPAFQDAVATFVAAAAVVRGLRNARVGQVGVRPASFETVGYDEAALALKFGQNVIYTELSDVSVAAQAYREDDPKIQETIREVRASFSQVTVSNAALVASARFENALMDHAKRSGLAALAVQCWPSLQSQMAVSMCALQGRLTGKGLPTACEADVLGALSMIVSRQSVLGRTPPHFIDWTIQHRDDPSKLLAWHCGNAPVCLAADPAKTAFRSRRDMTGTLPIHERDPSAGLAQFQLKPGPVTFCRLAEYDNKWKMLIARGEIIPSPETLAGTWAWVQVPNHEKLYRTLVEEGFVHHASMIHGDQAAALGLACRFLDIQPVIVA